MDAKIEQKLGLYVRGFRSAHGMSKVEFCNLAGVSRPQLDLIEEGRANVKLGTLERLASCMGVAAWEVIK